MALSFSSLEVSELDATRDDDAEWLNLKEETLMFNEPYVIFKFNDLDETTTDEPDLSLKDKNTRSSIENTKVDSAQKLVGLVEVEESNFKKNAILQWSKELTQENSDLKGSSSTFLSLIRKRAEVQYRLHAAHLREDERQFRSKNQPEQSSSGNILDEDDPKEYDPAVPVVVRLGVLTLFPLIESLSNIPEANYSKLCSRVLGILQDVLKTLPPLALRNESDDCVESFRDFTYNLIKNNNFVIDTEEKAQSVTALISLAVSRGSASDMFMVIDALFNLHKTMASSKQLPLKIASPLKQLIDYRKEYEVCALFERGYLTSWNINQTSSEAASTLTNQKLDAIASDGSYIYVHSFEKGLRKIGTGYGGTIKGSLYNRSTYRDADKQKTMACIGNRLYYLIPASTSPAQVSEEKAKDEEGPLQVAVIDVDTLQEVSISTLKVSGRGYLASEGQYLYFLTKQSHNKGTQENPENIEKHTVHIIDPNNDMNVVRTVDLGLASDNDAKEGSISTFFWDKISIYTTGVQLAVLIPMDGVTLTRTRVFSLKDGKFISDVKTRAQPMGVSFCYDQLLNVIWMQNDNKIESWKNLSVTSNGITSQFSPEKVLEPLQSLTSVYTPMQAIFASVASIDRLARQHPMYTERVVPEGYECVDSNDFLFCIEDNKGVFDFLYSIISKTNECQDLAEDMKGYIILTCLRLLKLNAQDNSYPLSNSNKYEKSDHIFSQVKDLLISLIKNPILQSQPMHQNIQAEAISALSMGLPLYFPSAQEQATLLIALLKDQTLSSGMQQFLENILAQLAEWNDVPKQWLRRRTSAAQANDKMDVEENVKPLEILESLLHYAYEEGVKLLNSGNQQKLPSLTPVLDLLVVLQREIVSDDHCQHLFTDYVTVFSKKCKQLLEVVLSKDVADGLLKSTILGPLLQSLLTALFRKKYIHNFKLANAVLPKLMELLKLVDEINRKSAASLEIDRQFLERTSPKKDNKLVLETRHPYLPGKNQYRQTVTIAGAKALNLHFDSRCRTASTNSDILQLFRSATLNDPVVVTKDGKNAVYSGTNWPKQAVIIPGDSVTFVFSANARPDKNLDSKYRWGFKCTITAVVPYETYQPIFNHWLMGIENSMSLLGGKFASAMIEGLRGSGEKRSLSSLECALFCGGLEEKPISDANSQFLEDYLSRRGAAIPLCAWMEKHTGRRVLSPASKAPLEQAERYVIAALLKQLVMVEDARSFAKALETGDDATSQFDKDKYVALAREGGKITMGLQQKGQAENEWRIAAQEKPTLEAFQNTWREEKKEKLLDMCQVKNVEVDSHDDKQTIANLYERLQEDINKGILNNDNKSQPYEIVSASIVDKAKLLLRTTPIELPAPPPLDLGRSLSTSISDLSNVRDKPFRKRLKDLRRWIHLPSDPQTSPIKVHLQDSTSEAVPVETLESLLRTQVTQAQDRIGGFNHLHDLLDTLSFNSARQQVLGTLGSPITSGGHYLDGVSACGLHLSLQLTAAFARVFEQLVKLIQSKTIDSASRSLALVVCGVSFQDKDAELLQKTQIFSTLRNIITEVDQLLSTKTLKPTTSFAKDLIKEDGDKKEEKAQRESQENDKLKRLRGSAWTAFRLLATRCVDWDPESGTENQNKAVKELQDQIFELMCSELKSISEKTNVEEEAGQQCFDLLSLLCLLGGSAKGHKSLSREENLHNLISILKINGSEPRTKRLALRLLRRLLPVQNAQSMGSLVSFFLNEIGSRIFSARRQRSPSSSEGKAQSEVKPDENSDIVMKDADIPSDDIMEDEEEGDEDDAVFDPQEELFNVFLNTWTLGAQRLVEVCQTTLGNDFFGAIPGNSLDRHAIEGKAQQILQEMANEGQALLKVTNSANAILLANVLATSGGTATIAPQPINQSPEEKGNKNKRRYQKKTASTTWFTGEVAHGLVSEYIYLLRKLLDASASSPAWNSVIQQALLTSLEDLPKVGSGAPEQAHALVGALCTLGGYSETLHVGGKAIYTSEENQTQQVTVVDVSVGNVEVIYDSDTSKTLRKVAPASLTPVSELELNPSLVTVSPATFNLMINYVASTTQSTWFSADLKQRVLKALDQLLRSPESAQVFLKSSQNHLSLLMQLANSTDAQSRVSRSEAENGDLLRKLWDLTTKPNFDTDDLRTKTMKSVLPYFPHSDVDLLPTGWTADKLQGFILRDNKRRIDFVGIEQNPLQGRRGQLRASANQAVEVLILANAPVPADIAEFYFEVTFLQTESTALMSVGIVPDGQKQWGNGSYKWQANAKRTTFNHGKRVQHDYGSYFRAKSVVGFGYNREEKTIYFTKDGVDQGPAFTGVSLGKFVPAVGISKGIHVSVNFGQDPFVYKLVVEGETPEEREKRKKEEEEKRLAEKQIEDDRRRKEKEDELAANKIAAQPLLNMGFTLKQALVAMKATNFSGPDAASNWLLENNVPEDDEEKPEEEKPVKQDKVEEKPEEEKSEPMKIDKPEFQMLDGRSREKNYGTGRSQDFYLSDNFSYNEDSQPKDQPSKITTEWEQGVIPAIKGFMEKDGFSSFEVQEFLQQIRTQLELSNEQGARAIVMQIVGDTGFHIAFPNSGGSSKPEKQTLKFEDLELGKYVTVSKTAASDAKNWVPPMQHTQGQTGIVKSLDHQNNQVLVQFYNSETAVLAEWWYSLKDLDKAEYQGSISPSLPVEDLQKRLAENGEQLSRLYARDIILTLLPFTSMETEAINVEEILRLLSREDVPTPLLTLTKNVTFNTAPHKVLPDKLLPLLESSKAEDTIKLLSQTCMDLFESCARLDLELIHTVTSSKPPAPSTHIKIEGARSMIVVFDRSGTSVASGSQSTFAFYRDEACTQLIASYGEKNRFLPLGIDTNEMWIKVTTPQPPQKNIKYKFSVVPVHPSLSLAFWIPQFLLNNGLKYIAHPAEVFSGLFETIVNYVYTDNVPSLLKESLFYLLSEFINVARRSMEPFSLPIYRLVKLRDEMVSLYDVEKNRSSVPCSSYLQSLIELMITVKQYEDQIGAKTLFLDQAEPKVDKSTDKKKKPEKKKVEKKPRNAEAEALEIAMVIANSLKESELKQSGENQAPPPPPPPPQAPSSETTVDTNDVPQDMGDDDDLAKALALSMSDSQIIPPEPQVNNDASVPQESTEEKPQDKPEEKLPEEILPSGEDDDMAMALALSLQSSMEGVTSTENPTPSEEKPQPETSKIESPPPAESAQAASPFEAMFSPAPSTSDAFVFGSPSASSDAIPPPDAPKKRTPSGPIIKPIFIGWFKPLVLAKSLLEMLYTPQNPMFRDLLKDIWETTKADNIRDRVVILENLPFLAPDKVEELERVIRRSVSEAAVISDVMIPIDPVLKRIRGYAFLEVVNAQKVDAVMKKMNRHRLKAPGLIEEIPNLRSSIKDGNIPRGVTLTHRLKDIEPSDLRLADYLQGKLLKNGELAPQCIKALTEIFHSFGGISGALVPHQLNTLQMASNGKTLSEEQISYALTHYKSKPVGEKNEMGLTLEGFLDLYLNQCGEAPIDTWDELMKLGYDQDLGRLHYIDFEEALASQIGWNMEVDCQLIDYAQMLAPDCELTSPIQLTPSHIDPTSSFMAFPALAKHSLCAIRLRFELLRRLNVILSDCLPLVNFDRVHPDSFAHLLGSHRGLIFHTTKFEFIYDILDKTSYVGPQPTVSLDRLKLAAKKDRAPMSLENSIAHTAFGIAFNQLKSTQPAHYRQKKPGGTEPHFSIKIVFKGENVQGEGGPYRQFFTDVSKELQGILPFFIPCPNAQQGLGENRDKWVLSPNVTTPLMLQMLEFLGRLFGLTIRTGAMLILDLPPIFWKPLVGIHPVFADLMQVDESVCRTLKYVAECSPEELERDIDETFTTVLSDKSRVPLMKNGHNVKVVESNRQEYVALVEKTRLEESYPLIAALRRGLADIIPLQLLNLCTWRDLEWKVCGESRVDINLLKRHTTCSGVSPDAAHIGYFWQTLQEFNQSDRRGFLRFAWAQERLPVSDEEFERTKTRMMIKPFTGLKDPNSAFPKTDTCFFNIMLPEYSSQKTLKERLLYAIYTDSHSMNADEPQEDELSALNGARQQRQPSSFEEESDSSDSE